MSISSKSSAEGDVSLPPEASLKERIETLRSEVHVKTTEAIESAFIHINNDIRQITHESHQELSAKEKLGLRRAIIDLTDTINERLIEQMQTKATATPQLSGGMWGLLVSGAFRLAKGATDTLGITTPTKTEAEKEELERFLKTMMGVQETLYDKEHPMSVQHAKEMIDEVLKNAKESEAEKLAEFLQSESVKELEHQERAVKIKADFDKIQGKGIQAATGFMDNISQQTASFVGMIKESAQSYLTGMKKELVESYVKQFTPEELFGNQSFREQILKLIGDLMTQRGGFNENSIITKIAIMQAIEREQYLSENLGILAHPQNLAGLSATIAQELSFIASKVRTLSDKTTPEEMIAALGYTGKHGVASLDEFREEMDATITNNIARLISKDAVIASENNYPGAVEISRGIWGVLRAKLNKSFRNLLFAVGKRFQKSAAGKFKQQMESKAQGEVAEEILTRVSPPSWLVKVFFPSEAHAQSKKSLEASPEKEKTLDADTSQILGFEKPLTTLSNCSEVLTLHLFCHLIQAMSDIAFQSKANNGIVKGYESPSKANENLRQAVGDLRSELSKFESTKTGAIGFGIEKLSGFFEELVTQQGTGSLLDVITDVAGILQPAWQKWLSPPSESKSIEKEKEPKS